MPQFPNQVSIPKNTSVVEKKKFYLIIFFSCFELTNHVSFSGFIKGAARTKAHPILSKLQLADLELIMHFSFSNLQFLYPLIIHFKEQTVFNDKA